MTAEAGIPMTTVARTLLEAAAEPPHVTQPTPLTTHVLCGHDKPVRVTALDLRDEASLAGELRELLRS